MKNCLAIMHPNMKNTGVALKMEMYPAHDGIEGSIIMRIAAQKTVGEIEEGAYYKPPTFDWENQTTIKLSMLEVVQFMEVFRGVNMSINEGRGLFHRTPSGNYVIALEHRIEPTPGYVLTISVKSNSDGGSRRYSIMFTPTESILIYEVFQASLARMAFG